MAANFAFQPFGLSQRVTVIASQGTVSFSIVRSGGQTYSLTSGNYNPTVVRLSNNSPVSAFLQFGDSTVTVGVNTGIELLPGSVETFKVVGMPFMAHISAGTLTIGITPGEGI